MSSWAVPVDRSPLTSAVASAAAINVATSCTALPYFAPRVLKFALTEISTRSPSACAISSSSRTLSSSEIWSFISAGRDDQPCAEMRARWRGWRILMADSARAARPSSTTRRVIAICSLSCRLMRAESATGKFVRCTDSAACESAGSTSSCQVCSAMKGTIGARSCVTVVRHWCNVASAATSPSQKRRRERRTYQLDRSSINRASTFPADCESKLLYAESTSETSTCNSLMIHLSIMERSFRAGLWESSNCDACAYSAWKEMVFQYVRSVLRTTSEIASWPTRRADQGEPAANMYQRTASAPCWSMSEIGSRTLPRCLLILRPSLSKIWPRQSTLLYELWSKTRVPMVMSV